MASHPYLSIFPLQSKVLSLLPPTISLWKNRCRIEHTLPGWKITIEFNVPSCHVGIVSVLQVLTPQTTTNSMSEQMLLALDVLCMLGGMELCMYFFFLRLDSLLERTPSPETVLKQGTMYDQLCSEGTFPLLYYSQSAPGTLWLLSQRGSFA